LKITSQVPSLKNHAVAYSLERKGIPNPTQGVYTNVVESTNAKYLRMRSDGTRSMPEGVFTVYNLHRNCIREIIRAYHSDGNLQLHQDFQTLARPSIELPKFNDRTEDELMDRLRGTRGFSEIGASVEEEVSDPAEVEVEEILRQKEWYDEDLKTRVIHDHDVRGFKVAAYERSMQEKMFITKKDSCTCERPTPCVHWMVVCESMGFTVSRSYLKEEVKKRITAEKRRPASKRKTDRGRKGPVSDGRDPAMPTLAKRPRGHFSTPRLLSRSKTPSTRNIAILMDDALPRLHRHADTEENRRNEEIEALSEQELSDGDNQMLQDHILGRSTTRFNVGTTSEEDSNFEIYDQVLASGQDLIVLEPTGMEIDAPHSAVVERHASETSVMSTSTVMLEIIQHVPQHELEILSAGEVAAELQELGKSKDDQVRHQENEIDIDNYSLEEIDNIDLFPSHYRYIFKNNEKVALIKADKFMKAVIFYKDTATTEEIAQFQYMGAKMIKSDCKYSLKDRTNYVALKTKKVPSEEFADTTRNEQEKYPFLVKGAVQAIKLQCLCKHPDIPNTHNNLDVTCEIGNQKFHSACVKTRPGEKSYKCAPCNLEAIHKGAVWSERKSSSPRSKEFVHNTCPIDGALTALAIHAKAYNKDLFKSFPKDQDHKALKKATEHLLNNDSYNAQRTMLELYKSYKEPALITHAYLEWYPKYIKAVQQNVKIREDNKKLPKSEWKKSVHVPERPIAIPYLDIKVEDHDLEGDHSELWSKTLKSGCSFKQEAKCNKCSYNENVVAPQINMYNIPCDDSVSLYIAKSFNTGFESRCHSTNCDGTIKVNPLQPVGKPWQVVWDLSSLPPGRNSSVVQDLCNGDLPKNLYINGEKYQLSHVLLNVPGTHYTSVHYDPQSNNWAFYDGKADFKKENSKYDSLISIHSVLYKNYEQRSR